MVAPTPILDNHVHLEPLKGRHVDAVRDFEKAGGTHIIVSHLPYDHIRDSTATDFRRSYEVTVQTVSRVNRKTGVKAFATVGPYPAEILGLEKAHGLEKARETMLEAMEIAAEFVREGKALAIGEVGRPHFRVSKEVGDMSNEILSAGMRLAKEVDCAIVLHTESATRESMRELAEMADRAALPRHRVVKHYCPPLVLEGENYGLMPSVLVGRDAARKALEKGSRFLMETDFLDDPRRPGAVLDIKTVPKRTRTMLESGSMTEEQALDIHQRNPRETYGDRFS